MNFLDIIIIIVLILLTLGALILQFMAVSEEEYGMIGVVFVMWLVICGFIFCASFQKFLPSDSGYRLRSLFRCQQDPSGCLRMTHRQRSCPRSSS